MSFFQSKKVKIDHFDPKMFGNFIIHLSGLWIMDQKIWFNWSILQAKIHTPLKLKEYMFIDENESVPPALHHRLLLHRLLLHHH